MTITFYLNNDRKQNLYCRISEGKERAVFSLGYKVDNKDWNKAKEELAWTDPHHHTLANLKKYLGELSEEMQAQGKTNIPNRIKNTLSDITKTDGISGIDRILFNKKKSEGVPEYDCFIEAFEKFSKLKKSNYIVEVLDNEIWFHTEDTCYIGHTCEGLTAELKEMVENRRYDELYNTDLSAWNNVLMDGGEAIGSPGIGRGTMYRELFNEWRIFWADKYKEIKECVGKTDHLDAQKEDSWKALQVFMECYSESITPLQDAENLDMDLCSCLILAMLNVYDKDTCYAEYCESHFEDWDSEEIKGDFVYFTENEFV